MDIKEINEAIKLLPNAGEVSDGYHTFDELYEHRVALFIALCNQWNLNAWKSKRHSDGTMYEWWFIAGIWAEKWKTLTYHLPVKYWEKIKSYEITNAPEWDGHTSEDVINLLYDLEGPLKLEEPLETELRNS